ncbi:sodium- and chloride-dependent glycine transporter 1-like [Haliotis rufescens]|uniref:sodium- and chloride-dependent glycine transporter 1-like n=1 Tax=Haliotis rufescens TaxID=6454 RepID=UPI00201E8684|nr:sodium- and chloride-dependent glycine transporter 1-like [Haliotis rufescens]
MLREKWRHHLDYVVTLLGFGIGSGSFVKFPYLCIRNGGGSFLIPFVLFTFMGTVPVVFLEMVIGQFSERGPVEVWNLCPAFKGVGVGTVIGTWIHTTYFTVIFSWFVYYFYVSFSNPLPWAHCGNEWNTPSCISQHADVNTTTGLNMTEDVTIYTVANHTADFNGTVAGMTAAEEFWRFQVLQITDGLETIGTIRLPLLVCLAFTCSLIFLCVFRGIKVTGKLVYVTVAIPCILVTIFLIRGCLLPGSADGIYFYIVPNFEILSRPQVWIEGCNFALYSLGLGMGSIVTLSSHSKFRNNCFRDSIIVCIGDMLVTLLIGFAFFAIIGHVAYQRGVTVEAFESSGFNLAFIVFPQVLNYLPLPQLWSALTFLTLITLELDTLVPPIENVVAALRDRFPQLSRRRWLVIAVLLSTNFAFGLNYITQGGMYVLTLVDWFAYFPSNVLFSTLECIVVGWCYGTDRLQRDIKSMWGKSIPRIMMIAIKCVCPMLLVCVFCYSLYSYRPPKYGDYDYPPWATGIGWMVSLASILPFPAVFVWRVWRSHGNTVKEKFLTSLEPNKNWREASGRDTQEDFAHPMTNLEEQL